MEHLFKLKKDGKTIGYEQSILQELLSDTKWAYKAMITQQRLPDGKWFDVLIGASYMKPILHDEKCPFVTKDKNGKDVFAGDKIKALYFSLEDFPPQEMMGKLDWRDETLNWVLYHTPNTPECVDVWKLIKIELIEEEQ